ncbi:MAG TPA: antitoxin, partial [Sumerlaeia bacterium]|nr:antitoxin [Sumerlaeia bacterium]
MMKTISIRGVDARTLEAIKQAARARAMSMNRFVLGILQRTVGTQGPQPTECHDLDEFFGTWGEDEYEKVTRAV